MLPPRAIGLSASGLRSESLPSVVLDGAAAYYNGMHSVEPLSIVGHYRLSPTNSKGIDEATDEHEKPGPVRFYVASTHTHSMNDSARPAYLRVTTSGALPPPGTK